MQNILPNFSDTLTQHSSKSSQTRRTTNNIAENKRNILSYKICQNIFDPEQISHNKRQQHTTCLNKVVK